MADDKPRELSSSDKKELARLLAKYGRKFIVAAAKEIRYSRCAGRPRDDDKRGELWEHIEWIEARADEDCRKHGALQRAVIDRFRMVTPYDEQTQSELEKFAKRIKNARDEWSRVERATMAARRDARARGLMWSPKRPRTRTAY